LQRWFLQHAFADPDKYHKSLNELLLQKGVYLIDPFTEGPFKFKEIPRSSFPEKPNESTRTHLDQCFTTFKAKLSQLPAVPPTQSQAPVVPKPQTTPAATAPPQQKTDFTKQLSDMHSKTWKSIDEITRRMQTQLAQEEAQQKAQQKAQFDAQAQQNQLRQAQLRRQQQQAAIDQQLEYTRRQWANINGETYYDGDGKRRYRPGYLDYMDSCIF
jgi:glucan-binding YG repeat protein